MFRPAGLGRAVALACISTAAAFAATITGVVKDSSGAAVAGAKVEIRAVPPIGSPKTIQTDASGAFRLSDLHPGRYQVFVFQRGFEPAHADAILDDAKEAAVELKLTVAEMRQQLDVSASRRPNTDSVYRGLRDAVLVDAFTVENLVLRRDNGVLTLKSGAVAFTPAVMGRDTVAVFIGEGEFTFDPVLSVEKDHLKLITDQETVHDVFDRALFAFTDSSGTELRGGAKPRAADAKFNDVLHDYRKHLRSRSETPRSMLEYMLTSETMDNVEADLLTDLQNPAQPGFFSAYLHGRKHSDLRFHVKPRGVLPDLAPEEVAVINFDPQGEQEGIWYLSHFKSEFERHTASSDEDHRVVRAERYRIETVIARNDHFTATTELHLKALTNGDRVIKFGLLPNLRVTRVSVGGRDIPFLQEDRHEDASFYALMPQPMPRGSEHDLVVEYQGDKVVHKAGGGNFSVGARESWYPVVNTFRDHALYTLVFKVPKEYTLVSVGKLVKEWREDNFECTEWNSGAPVAVAGFNYGAFKKKQVTDSDTGIQVEGYAAMEAPDYLKGAENMGAGSMTPSRLLDQALTQAQNSERIFNTWFGKSEFTRIAITQQPEFSFGQSWPTLVYLPMSAFLDSTQRWRLMGIRQRLTEFVDEVTAHEVSHQWWGHEVGWASYHDQWLSEGFAFFSAGLYLQLTEKDPSKYVAYWQHARELLTEKNAYGRRPNDAGPVWMGLRLSSFKNAGGYNSVVYRKGGYVLHMLRALMFDIKEGDRRFIEMLKDFVTQNRNGNPSSETFQAVAERHMHPNMDVMGNGKLDWFFAEWVYGTTIPKYKLEYTVAPEADGKWMLNASLTQSEVPARFVMLVPVYVDFEGHPQRLGAIRITGNSTVSGMKVLLPAKPRKVMINAFHDVLEQ
jgi:hypothetical protein